MLVLQRDLIAQMPSLPTSVLEALSCCPDAEVWDIARSYGISSTFLASCCSTHLECRDSSSLCQDPDLEVQFPNLKETGILPLFETDQNLCIATANPFHFAIQTLKDTIQKPVKTIVITDTTSDNVQLDTLIQEALTREASDIHFFSSADTISVHFRQLGAMIPFIQLPKTSPMIQKIKLIANMDISCVNLPQDGHFVSEQLQTDVRVSSLPTLHGEDLVLRLMPKAQHLKPLDQLGFPIEILSALNQILNLKSGLILVTGPTGSGKTTTLYALLKALKEGLAIVSIEDPIEVELKGIRQSQINPKISYGFSEALRAILRQDPDVIMVGEIRDKETAKTALDAAYTGHLVFATLHTDSIEATLHRFASFDCDPFLIETCIKGILSQRLDRVGSTRIPKGSLKIGDSTLWF